MSDKDKYLLNKNGEPFKTVDGKPLFLDYLDDPLCDPELDVQTLADVFEELIKLGISVPDNLNMKVNEKFLLKQDGIPYRTANGSPVLLDSFDQDPTYDEELASRPDEEVDAEIEALGLGEFLSGHKHEEEESAPLLECRQLEEVLSWRFITELWRRFPRDFRLIEAHPGGGQYDCLVLVINDEKPEFAIDVNRGGGSVHIHKMAFGLGDDITLYPNWVSKMLQSNPKKFIDNIANDARLVSPEKLPPSTPTTIVYRFIADFLAHSVGRLEKWECRNGYEDTSGYGGGKRGEYFEVFSGLKNDDSLRHTKPFLGEYAYNFWFILRNDIPVLCLDTTGMAHLTDGNTCDLECLYKYKKKIWPVIYKVAGELLP